MTLPEAIFLVLAVMNGGLAGMNFWHARRNARSADKNLAQALENLRSATRIRELGEQARDLHRARMSVYSAVEAHIRAIGGRE